MDDDVVYREIPENYYQQWEQDFDVGYFVHQVMSRLARSAGAIVMDRFFFQNVMPRFLLPLVGFAKDWGLLRFFYIAIILANLMLNWAVGQLLGRLCVRLTYAYHLAVIVHNYCAPEVGFAALGAVFLLARELFFGTRNAKGEVQAAARFIPVALRAPEVDWMWFMGVAQVAAAYGLDRAGEDGVALYCTAMLTF